MPVSQVQQSTRFHLEHVLTVLEATKSKLKILVTSSLSEEAFTCLTDSGPLAESLPRRGNSSRFPNKDTNFVMRPYRITLRRLICPNDIKLFRDLIPVNLEAKTSHPECQGNLKTHDVSPKISARVYSLNSQCHLKIEIPASSTGKEAILLSSTRKRQTPEMNDTPQS